jgi:hypothetical protein
MFGYVVVPETDPWYLGPLVGAGALQLQAQYPELIRTYTGGAFAGHPFAVADTLVARGLVDGGAGYDQGYAGVLQLETVAGHPDRAVRRAALASACAAADWSLTEPCVTNHNYTAKLVWLLAAAYAATGEPRYREGLLDKLQRCILPGVLMDHDRDGIVDGTTGIAFASLTAVAQRPGRLWDGHNALPWYHAKTANAVVEAYVALRDRGDTAAAAYVRPWAIAMLDNLAWEVIHLGVHDRSAGFDNLPQPLLIGLWKVAMAEGEDHPTWADAASVLWNAGKKHGLGAFTLDAGLYLLVSAQLPYHAASTGEVQDSDSAIQVTVDPAVEDSQDDDQPPAAAPTGDGGCGAGGIAAVVLMGLCFALRARTCTQRAGKTRRQRIG